MAIPASAIATFTRASSRASSTTSVCVPMRFATVIAIWLYKRGGAQRLGVPSYAQKTPMNV